MVKESRFQILIKSELLRNTSILISGTALAQLIPLCTSFILRRGFFTTETFGAYSVYLSLLGILIAVSTLKYELAIILPRKDSEAANILFLTIIINFLFNILLLLVILVWHPVILNFLNLKEEFASYLYFVPLGTFFFSTYQSINYWLIRKKRFTPISINKFARRGFEGVAQVGFKFTKVTHGLIFGDLIGHIANIISGIFQGVKSGLSLRLFSPVMIKTMLKKYSEYPKFSVIPGLMSACSYLLPVLLINKYFSSENTGFFDSSKLLLSIPLALVASSISNVLLQSMSEKFRNKESILKELTPIFAIVVIISIVEIIVIEFFGVNIFTLVFGKEWAFSGTISGILVWAYALNFIGASFSSIFISMNKIKMLGVWQLFYFVSILSLILFRDISFLGFIKVYVFIEVICYFVILALMTYLLIEYESKIKLLNKVN